MLGHVVMSLETCTSALLTRITWKFSAHPLAMVAFKHTTWVPF